MVIVEVFFVVAVLSYTLLNVTRPQMDLSIHLRLYYKMPKII